MMVFQVNEINPNGCADFLNLMQRMNYNHQPI